jgi:transposase
LALTRVIWFAVEAEMPAALNADLRLRVVETYENGDDTVEDVAARFRVGPASLKRWVWQWRATGSVAPKPQTGGRPPKMTAECDGILRELVADQPDAYCWELAERLEARNGVRVDEDTIGRALTRLGITRKKKRSKRPSNSATT